MAITNTLYRIGNTVTVGSGGASNFDFTSIPQTYTDLVLVAFLVPTGTQSGQNMRVGNGSVDTATNYSQTNMWGTGSAAASGRESNQSYYYPDDNGYFSAKIN